MLWSLVYLIACRLFALSVLLMPASWNSRSTASSTHAAHVTLTSAQPCAAMRSHAQPCAAMRSHAQPRGSPPCRAQSSVAVSRLSKPSIHGDSEDTL